MTTATVSSSPTSFSDEELTALKTTLRGDLIQRGDPDYEDARAVYNAMIDKRPAMIVRCVDVADVVATVNFAREHGLLLAVQGGGHSVAGLSTCDDGLVLDLSRMKGIWVDPDTRTVRAQGGCTFGDIDHATHIYGLATPGGIVSTTGAGLVLGGGIGHLMRKCGLSVDNIRAAEVVLADGRVVTASGDQNKDLFWAIRGGGGNFGVVTSIELQLHPVGMVMVGLFFWPIEAAPGALRLYRDYIGQAPEELTALFVFTQVPPGPPFPEDIHLRNVCAVVATFIGDPDDAGEVLGPFADFDSPLFSMVTPMPLPVLQSLFDPLVPPGLQNYWKGDLLEEMSEAVIAVHSEHGASVPNFHSGVFIYPMEGAPQQVANDATAFSYRDARFVEVIAAAYEDPAETPAMREWVRGYWEALRPHTMEGNYVNFLGNEEEPDRVATTYRDNYDRLRKVKAKYDPSNLFSVNQNIPPA